jgi:hypothetical protein
LYCQGILVSYEDSSRLHRGILKSFDGLSETRRFESSGSHYPAVKRVTKNKQTQRELVTMFAVIRKTVVSTFAKFAAASTSVKVAVVTSLTMASAAVVPAIAAATESEAEKKAGEKITETVTKVGLSGEDYILLVLAGLAGLIALVIILPKAISFIKRFI